MLIVLAPAKLNLTLEVLAKRQDGFHEIRSVVQTINLCDRLSFELSQDIEFTSSWSDWTAEKSLVSKATTLLKQTFGCDKGVKVYIEKAIPLVSGLGGDSGDAAAVLKGLNRLWEMGLSQEELIGLADRLGSDVPFFLYGGTALIEGRGEIVTPLPSLPRTWLVLAIPPVPTLSEKTKQLYNSLDSNHYTNGEITRKLVE